MIRGEYLEKPWCCFACDPVAVLAGCSAGQRGNITAAEVQKQREENEKAQEIQRNPEYIIKEDEQKGQKYYIQQTEAPQGQNLYIQKAIISPDAFLNQYDLKVQGPPSEFQVKVPESWEVPLGAYPVGLYWGLANETVLNTLPK